MLTPRPFFLSVFPIVVAMSVPLCSPNVRPASDGGVAARFIAALRSRISRGQQIAGNDWLQP